MQKLLLLGLAAFAAFSLSTSAQAAQSEPAIAVTNCGVPYKPLAAGQPYALTVKASTGELCMYGAGGGGGTSSAFGSSFPANGTAAGFRDGSGNMTYGLVDGSHYLQVNIAAGLGALATSAKQDTGNSSLSDIDIYAAAINSTIGGTEDSAWNGSDTAATAIAIMKYEAAKAEAIRLLIATGNTSLATIITNLGSPFQVGGSIGNTAFAISGTLPAFAATPTFNLGTLNGAATAANQLTANTSLSSIATNTATDATNTTAISTAAGAIADTAYAGSGSGSIVAVLKGIYSRVAAAATSLASTLTVSGTVTANAGTNLNTSGLAVESGGHLAAIDTATGAQADSAYAGSGSTGIIAALKGIYAKLAATLTINISPTSVAPTNCSSTITSGGTAQLLIAAGTRHFVQIQNASTDPLAFSELTATPAVNTNGSWTLSPAGASAAGGSWSTSSTYVPNTNIYIVGATTGDKFTCSTW